MSRQEIERPGERQRRGLGAGPQILLHLIDHLLMIEFGEARIGLGGLDHPEQRLLAVLEDVGADHGVGDRAPHLHGLGRVFLRDLDQIAAHLLQADRLVVHHVGVGLDLAEHEVRIERHLAVEQRLAHHVGGQRPGLLDHLDGLAGLGELLPPRHLGVDGRHQIGEVHLEHIGVKGSLLGAANLLPERTVDGDHALAEDRPEPFEIFRVIVGVGDEHAFGVSRLAQEDHALVLEIDGDHAPIFFAERHENLHRVLLGEKRRELEPDALLFAKPMLWRIGDVHIGHFPPDPICDEASSRWVVARPGDCGKGPKLSAGCLDLTLVCSTLCSSLSIFDAKT